jgi:hypothetical protein
VDEPIFLLGSARSGTTLLRLLLTSHPEVAIAPESSFLTWFADAYSNWDGKDVASPRRTAFVADLMAARKFATWGLAADAIDARILLDCPRNYADLAAIPYRLYAESIGKPNAQWGDKNNIHMDFVPQIDALFENARFLHIVRDVRDCFVSSADIRELDSTSPYKPNLSADPVEFAKAWDTQNRQALAALSALGSDRWATIRYEDLVARPEETLSPVLHKWGLEWHDAMLSFHVVNRNQQLEPIETSEWKALVSEPVTDSQVGRFRDRLTGAQIAALEDSGREMLEQFGYVAANGDGP